MKTLYRRTYLILVLAALVASAWLVESPALRLVLAGLAGALTFTLIYSRGAALDALERSLASERVRTQILQLLLRSDLGDFQVNLERALRRMAAFTRSGAAFLYGLEEGRGVGSVIWAGVPGGTPCPPDQLATTVAEAVRARRGQAALELRHEGRPLLLVPLVTGTEAWGAVGLYDRGGRGRWSGQESRLLHATAELLGAAHARHRAELATHEALEQAQARNEAKSRFLANGSHEIRTPLNCIVGLCEHLGELEPTREQRHSLELIRHASDVLLQIINDILDLSRIEAGGMALADEAFNLRRLLDNTVGIFATRADDKGLSLDLDVPDDLPPVVRGDAARLGQILTNLIGNAVKFTREGGICLAVSVGRAPGGVAAPDFRFDVTDSGIGIAPDKLDRIFDCFTQADPSTNRLYGGTGLGLAISRSLAELMGGRLSAASVEGQGSVFSLELSLAPVNVAAGRSADRAEDSEPPAQFPGFRVLVVEDDALNQMVTRKMLNSLGCDVEVVEDGRLALDLVTWQEFDLILMDFQMPGLDGPETTRALRAREGWCAEVPVVALTANALDTHQRICLEAGMDGFLTKPIRKRELAHTLASLLAPARLS